jgi:hypothetical protein
MKINKTLNILHARTRQIILVALDDSRKSLVQCNNSIFFVWNFATAALVVCVVVVYLGWENK